MKESTNKMAKLLQNLPMISEFIVDESSNLDKKWKIYREEIDLYLMASGITNDAQKRAVLLHLSGPQVREIFSTLENTGNSYKEATVKLDEYFLPKKKFDLREMVF